MDQLQDEAEEANRVEEKISGAQQPQECAFAALEKPAETAVGEQGALLAAIRQLQLAAEKQTAQLKRQLSHTRLCAICLAGMLAVTVVGVAVLLPSAGRVLRQVDGVLGELRPTVETLAEADIAGTLKNANELILESRNGLAKGLEQLEEASKKLQAFDIDTLNGAIRELENVIKPLAKLFGR